MSGLFASLILIGVSILVLPVVLVVIGLAVFGVDRWAHRG